MFFSTVYDKIFWLILIEISFCIDILAYIIQNTLKLQW